LEACATAAVYAYRCIVNGSTYVNLSKRGSNIAIVAALLMPVGTRVLGKRRAAFASELAV
jgi:hypothetical protein